MSITGKCTRWGGPELLITIPNTSKASKTSKKGIEKKSLILGLVERESTLICMNFSFRPCPYLG